MTATLATVLPLPRPADPRSANRTDDCDQAGHAPGWHTEAPDAGWDLVRATQAGDTAAFGEFYTRYEPFVRAYVRKRANSRVFTPETVEDLVSATFTAALHYIRAADPNQWPDQRDRPVFGWLATIALNTVATHANRAHVRKDITFTDYFTADGPGLDHQTGPGWVDEYGNPEHEVLAQIDRDAIAMLIGAGMALLSPVSREMLVAWMAERSPAEIAATTGRTQGTVNIKTTLARRKLADILAPDADRWDNGYPAAIGRARSAHAAAQRGRRTGLPCPPPSATAWLREYLSAAGGSAPGGDVMAAAQRAGYGRHTLYAARDELGIGAPRKDWTRARWMWDLPGTDTDPWPPRPDPTTPLGQLDPDDQRPAYQQVAAAVRAAIAAGVLVPGAMLPTQGTAAAGFGVTVRTVARAYAVLAGEGVIVSRQGRGAHVATTAALMGLPEAA